MPECVWVYGWPLYSFFLSISGDELTGEGEWNLNTHIGAQLGTFAQSYYNVGWEWKLLHGLTSTTSVKPLEIST